MLVRVNEFFFAFHSDTSVTQIKSIEIQVFKNVNIFRAMCDSKQNLNEPKWIVVALAIHTSRNSQHWQKKSLECAFVDTIFKNLHKL